MNNNLYRPKKLIEDIRTVDNNYFESKDISLTPLTKIGDAVSSHKEQKAGRMPSLSQKLKPNQLATQALQSRRGSSMIKVHRAGKSPSIFAFKDKIAAMKAVSARVARQAYDLLPSHKWTMPLAVSAGVLLIGATIGGVSVASRLSAQQESIRNTSKLSQDNQRPESAGTTKKRAKTAPDQNKTAPPAPTPQSPVPTSDSTDSPNSSSGTYSKRNTSNSQSSNNVTSAPPTQPAQDNTPLAPVPSAAPVVTNQLPATTPTQSNPDTPTQASGTSPSPTPTPTADPSQTTPTATPTPVTNGPTTTPVPNP